MKTTFIGATCLLVAAISFSAFIDLDNLDNYTGQGIPNYITKDNTPPFNLLSDPGATLGRVLFYDKQLSANGTISCSSCHKQELAFSDFDAVSTGLNGGVTGRHSMRLAYARFSDEENFFWDERAESVEDQSTRPIKDFTEMGFSGEDGQPGFDSLINRLSAIPYYQTLFTFVYGDDEITEERIQLALGQFVRSIYSFDSRFDEGLAAAGNLGAPFSNFTAEENLGKSLFLTPPPDGGAGCQGCHRAPEFDIDPNSLNNGIIAVAADPELSDLTNTRAPSLRDLFNPEGTVNGLLMHNGTLTINQVLNHYNLVPQDPSNTNLDPRLAGPGGNLGLTPEERSAIVAFLRTLSSQAIYTGVQWSDPFDEEGNLEVLGNVLGVVAHSDIQFNVFPNPANEIIQFSGNVQSGQATLFDASGHLVMQKRFNRTLDISSLPSGLYHLVVHTSDGRQCEAKRLIVQ